jgi:hypothetical protein
MGGRWILFNTLGWAAGFAAVYRLGPNTLVSWAALGAIVAAAEGLALRRRFRRLAAWMGVAFAAWAVGAWAGSDGFSVLDPLPAGLAGGTFAGLAQSWLLRGQVSKPALWAPTIIIGSTLGWIGATFTGLWVYFQFHSEIAGSMAGGATVGIVIGLVSALVLRWMKKGTP